MNRKELLKVVLIFAVALVAFVACNAGTQVVTLTGSLDTSKAGVASVSWDGTGHITVEPGTVVYRQDFSAGPDSWITSVGGDYSGYGGPQLVHVVDWDPAGFIKSYSAPTDHLWFADLNHTCRHPYVTTTGAQPCTFPKAMTMWKRVDGQNGTPVLPVMNLNGATLTVRIKGSSNHPNPNLYFYTLASWTDSYGKTHASEYYDPVHPIPLLPDWHTFTFRLEPENFKCAGSITFAAGNLPELIDRNDLYDCHLSAAQVLSHMDADFELVFTDIDPVHMVQGEVYLDSISIVR